MFATGIVGMESVRRSVTPKFSYGFPNINKSAHSLYQVILNQMKIPSMIRIKECYFMAKISLHENFANFLFRKIKTIVYRLRTGKKQAKFSFYEVELHL